MKVDAQITHKELWDQWEQGLIDQVLVVITKQGWRIMAKSRKGAANDPRGFKIVEAKEE